nr:trypsin 3A1-like [Aedes albopictus]
MKFTSSEKKKPPIMLLLHILLSVLSPLVYSSEDVSSRGSSIVGGHDIDIRDVPYQVSLQTKNHSHICGGSIISPSWILTAAHCTEHENITVYGVRVGSANYSSGGEFIPIKKIFPHPKYNATSFDYDFSLLQLAKGIVLKSTSQIVALPLQKQVVLANTPCIVSGWGKTRDTDSEPSEILQATSVLVYKQKDCNEIYGGVTDRMICTGTHGQRGACRADSGGPLVASRQLIGVVSWGGPSCGNPEYPDVYARVSAVRGWIYHVTNI